MGRYSFLLNSLLVLTMLPAMPAQSQGPLAQFNPPKSYYLALGDSLAYGFQSFKFAEDLPPSAYNTGYVDVFGARLRQIRPAIVTVNYGCPGESTESFVTGGCIWTTTGHLLHDSFSGSQLQAALTFLIAHPDQVSPITFTLGTNDLPGLLTPCTVNGNIDGNCVLQNAPSFISNVVGRISAILHALRSAAPSAEIIVMGAPDPYISALAFADPLYQSFDSSLAEAASADRARFADPFPIFNPQGDLSYEVQTICTLTLLCRDADSHPSDAGYQALAALVFDVSQYIRLQN